MEKTQKTDVLLVKDVGIEKTTETKIKHEKITNILTIIWGLLTLTLSIQFYNQQEHSVDKTFKMTSEITDILLCIFGILIAGGITAIIMFLPSLFCPNRWELCTLWGKRIIKIVKYIIIFIPLYFLTSCIFGLGDLGDALSNN